MRIAIVTLEQEGIMHKAVREEMDKIARAAGVEMNKTARIIAQRGMRQQQAAGVEQLNVMLQRIKETGSKLEAIKWGLVAAGYANGMHCGNLMSKSELNDVIQVIDQTFQKAELRIKAAKCPSWLRMIRKLAKA